MQVRVVRVETEVHSETQGLVDLLAQTVTQPMVQQVLVVVPLVEQSHSQVSVLTQSLAQLVEQFTERILNDR